MSAASPAGAGLVIRRRRGYLLGLAAVCAVFVLIGLWLLLFRDPSSTLWHLSTPGQSVMAVAIIAFFGLALAVVTREYLRNAPVLRVDAQGLDDTGSQLAVGHIGWDEVTGFEVRPAARQRALAVHVRDPEALVARLSGRRRTLARANWRLVGTPVTIPVSGMDHSEAEILAAVEAHAPGRRLPG